MKSTIKLPVIPIKSPLNLSNSHLTHHSIASNSHEITIKPQ